MKYFGGIKKFYDFWSLFKTTPMLARKISLLLLAMCRSALLSAQTENPDFMRSIGKIYVVVAVIIVIFIGIVIFLVYLDRKLTKLENQIKNHD